MKAPYFIVGCGYTGLVLARHLIASGERVIGTTRDPARLAEIAATGAEARLFCMDEDAIPDAPLAGIFVLAPVPDDMSRIAKRFSKIFRSSGRVPVTVVVSTALLGDIRGPVTEKTVPQPKSERAQRWALLEALCLHHRQRDGQSIQVVRTPAIYGPGRCFEAALLRGDAKVIENGPSLSRIHVTDLARLLHAMSNRSAPPILMACDDAPAPTWQVMEEAARVLGVPGPQRIPLSEASHHFTPRGLEMRLSGRTCVSRVRPHLVSKLRFPSYREGVRASLQGEAWISPEERRT